MGNFLNDNLLVGTKQGHLLMYKFTVKKPTGEHKSDLIRSNKFFSKKAICQMELVPDLQILVTLSDNVVSIHDMTAFNFPLISTVAKTRGATLFALDIQRKTTETGEQVCILRMCAAVKRKLQLFYWKKKSFEEFGDDLAVTDIPKSMTWCGESLCLGFKQEYCLIKMNGDLNNLFLTGKSQEPKITKLHKDRLALGRDEKTIIIDSKGQPIIKYPIGWSDSPVVLEDDPPYLIGILPNQVEVRTIEPRKLIQTLELPKPRYVTHCKKGQVYIASTSHVWCLMSVPISDQITHLEQEKQFELALKLVNISDSTDKEKEKMIQRIQNLHAFDLVCKLEFKGSMDIFLKLGTDPSHVIGLFPDLLPQDYRSKLEYPDTLPELKGIELENGLLALVEYLIEVRHSLMSDLSQNVHHSTAIVEGSSTINSKRQLLQIIDTTLIKCYLKVNEFLLSNDSDNSDVDYEPMESDNETIDSYESDDVDLSEHEDDGVMLSDSWKRIADIFSDCRPNSLPELVRNFSGVNPALNCNANNSVLDCFKKFITNDVIVLSCDRIARSAGATPHTNDALVSSLLRLSDNHCHIDETERALKKHQKYDELIILYQNKGLHRKALDLLHRQSQKPESPLKGHDRTVQYLQHLGKDNLDLIFEFSSWVLEKHPEDGLKIFLDDIQEIESLPRQKVLEFLLKTNKDVIIPYLEHVVYDWEDLNPNFHNTLVHMYRDKVSQLYEIYRQSLPEGHLPVKAGHEPGEVGELRKKLISFLESSSSYTAETLPSHFLNDNLYEERAVVMGKLGHHEEALNIYINILGDPDQAKLYCQKNYDKNKEGNKDVYVILLKMNLSALTVKSDFTDQHDGRNKTLNSVLSILGEHAKDIDPLKVLSLLPDSTPLHYLRTFLQSSLLIKMTEKRESQILKSLLYAEHLQVQENRIQCQSHKFIIDDFQMCPVCRKRIGTSAFARFPSSVIVHYSCKDRYIKSLQ
ncbi:Vam6/Vps39-like protein [Nymphon striatum]|nr:Vam6/Vps39-like protein [Nymphon striatum]